MNINSKDSVEQKEKRFSVALTLSSYVNMHVCPYKGQKGFPGFWGISPPGFPGPKGFAGQKGSMGPPGIPGATGDRGLCLIARKLGSGPRGDSGEIGVMVNRLHI